jgi:hypothetical protein
MLPVALVIKKFPTFYGTGEFITVITGAFHFAHILKLISSIYAISSHPISLISILILYIHLSLGIPSSLPLAFPPKLYMHFCSYTCVIHAMLIPSSYISSFRIILGEVYISRSTLLCSLFEAPTTSYHFPTNILSLLFPNTLSLCSSLNVRDQVSHPCGTTCKIRVF